TVVGAAAVVGTARVTGTGRDVVGSCVVGVVGAGAGAGATVGGGDGAGAGLGAATFMKSTVTKSVPSEPNETPMPVYVKSGSSMFSRCGGLLTKASWTASTVPPIPTFSPSLRQLAVTCDVRLGLWEIVPCDTITSDQLRAID